MFKHGNNTRVQPERVSLEMHLDGREASPETPDSPEAYFKNLTRVTVLTRRGIHRLLMKKHAAPGDYVCPNTISESDYRQWIKSFVQGIAHKTHAPNSFFDISDALPPTQAELNQVIQALSSHDAPDALRIRFPIKFGYPDKHVELNSTYLKHLQGEFRAEFLQRVHHHIRLRVPDSVPSRRASFFKPEVGNREAVHSEQPCCLMS